VAVAVLAETRLIENQEGKKEKKSEKMRWWQWKRVSGTTSGSGWMGITSIER
jgi:hypothetical protein